MFCHGIPSFITIALLSIAVHYENSHHPNVIDIQQPRMQETTQPTSREIPRGREKIQVQFADNVETRLIDGHDTNLRFTDESKAYTAYTSRGHFTPHRGE